MPPRRRSSRLRASSTTPAKPLNYASHTLVSLVERDETPPQGVQSDLDLIGFSPLAPRTPATRRVKPSAQEMHPSKAHQSTTKEPDSGLRLGFVDIENKGNEMPSGVTQQTPSKTGISSTFDFKFARPGPQLGPEAQRMMDDLREEALRIKVKLAAEREQEKRNAAEESNLGGRKIALPKGKVGRFSDAHMAEFKKMDSIADHPSAFRSQLERLTPAKPNLKRSQSKAKLNDQDEVDNTQKATMTKGTERVENTVPAKRARQNMADDISSARPVSREDQIPKAMPSTPTVSRTQSNLLTSITTPTQASIARATSVKQSATQIPTLSRSPSKSKLNCTLQGVMKSAPMSNIGSAPRSQSKNFLRSPGKLDRVKSILRYPSSSKKPSAAPSPVPSLVRSPSKPDLEKALPPLPTTPGVERSKSTKKVNFTPDTTNKNAAMVLQSPSPFKSAMPRSASRINLTAKAPFTNQTNAALPKAKEIQYPSVADLQTFPSRQTVEYPSLVGIRPFSEPQRQAESEQRAPPSVPGTFTFRSDHTIQFGTSPKGFGSSPGQSSVRQVRQSIFPGTMPGSFPGSTGSNKENKAPLASVPHGMSNKKRRRVDSDDEEEKEVERSPKKQKQNVPEGAMLVAPRIIAEKMAPASKIPSPAKKKNFLSMSRLNMLAQPKNRK